MEQSATYCDFTLLASKEILLSRHRRMARSRGGSMRKNVCIALICGIAFGTEISLAQDLDGCNAVLSTSARNYSVDQSFDAVSYSIYQQYCENDQVRSGTNFSVGLDAVIKAVPIKFNLGNGGTEERTKYFCKTFSSDYKANSGSYQQSSLVVGETTKAWLQCKQLEAVGVGFTASISHEHVNIDVRRTNANEVKVQGVIYDQGKMSCTVPNSDGKQKRVVANGETVKSLSSENWVVTCVRTPIKSTTETVYPGADVTVVTTAGEFMLPVPVDAEFPRQWASEFQKSLNQLGDFGKNTVMRVSALETKMTSTPTSAWGPDKSFGGGTNAVPLDSECPAGQVMVGIQIVTGGTCHGQCDPDGRALHRFKIQCAPRF